MSAVMASLRTSGGMSIMLWTVHPNIIRLMPSACGKWSNVIVLKVPGLAALMPSGRNILTPALIMHEDFFLSLCRDMPGYPLCPGGDIGLALGSCRSALGFLKRILLPEVALQEYLEGLLQTACIFKLHKSPCPAKHFHRFLIH